MWLSSVWQCAGGDVCPHLGQTGTGLLSCACYYWVLSGKENGEKFGVCLNIDMQDYNWEVMYLKGPSQITGCFSLSCSFLNRSLIPSETQTRRVCVWLLCPLLSCFSPFDHRRSSSALWFNLFGATASVKNRPTNARGGWGICCRWMNRGLRLVGGDHLAQELVMLVTDMMLQRFFTIMLM